MRFVRSEGACRAIAGAGPSVMTRPSKEAPSQKSGAAASVVPDKSPIPGCVRSLPDSTVAISIHAKPGSRLSAITGAHAFHFPGDPVQVLVGAEWVSIRHV